ncbi:hypothetical protein Anapl_16682 [Anas platyrhynchos]|uniref:Uncharacterized protein n=1 Tax=Anas platyrhynchos TaxID=8839 RepID=R0JHH4_ANAPL|nr:hypothetical protein Anapl_16682 [Anas platyrhynchos]
MEEEMWNSSIKTLDAAKQALLPGAPNVNFGSSIAVPDLSVAIDLGLSEEAICKVSGANHAMMLNGLQTDRTSGTPALKKLFLPDDFVFLKTHISLETDLKGHPRKVQCKFDYFLNHLLTQGAKTKPKILGLVVFDSWSSAKASNCQAEPLAIRFLQLPTELQIETKAVPDLLNPEEEDSQFISELLNGGCICTCQVKVSNPGLHESFSALMKTTPASAGSSNGLPALGAQGLRTTRPPSPLPVGEEEADPKSEQSLSGYQKTPREMTTQGRNAGQLENTNGWLELQVLRLPSLTVMLAVGLTRKESAQPSRGGSPLPPLEPVFAHRPADSHGPADGVLVATLAEYFAIQCPFIKKVLNGLYLDAFNST